MLLGLLTSGRLGANPQVQWSSYFQFVAGLAVDFQGNAVVCGTVDEYDDWFDGRVNPTLGLSGFAYVSKFSPDGTLLWTTQVTTNCVNYIIPWGGTAIAVDGQGNIVSTGGAGVVKLSPDGTVLWATIIAPGTPNWLTQGIGIATDNQDNVLVTGNTYQAGWTHGGFDTTIPSAPNGVSGFREAGFVLKLSPNGTPLWSTYFGGTDGADGTAVAVDNSGNVLVTGGAASYEWLDNPPPSPLPGKTNYVLPSKPFVLKLDPNGGRAWAKYLEGDQAPGESDSADDGSGIATDSQGNVFVSGWTSQSGWTSGGYDTFFQPSTGFLVKLSPNGATLWSSFVGGIAGYGWGSPHVAVDPYGNVEVAGLTVGLDWAFGGFGTYQGAGDAFFQKFDSSCTPLWAAYLGGTNEDWAAALAVDRYGNVWVGGGTESAGWTQGGYETNFRNTGGQPTADGFLAKIEDGVVVAPPGGIGWWSNPNPWIPSVPTSTTTLILCPGSTIIANVPNARAGAVTLNPGSTLNVQAGAVLTVSSSVLENGVLNVQSGGNLTVGAGGGGLGLVQSSGNATVDGTVALKSPDGGGAYVAYNQRAGTLEGSGTIDGNLVAGGGVIAPGDAPGTFTITSNFIQNADSMLRIEVSGPGGGQFGQLKVGGLAQLGGTLSVALLNGFTPAAGDRFQILSCGSLSNAFSRLAAPAGLSVTYSNTGAWLVVTGTVPAQILGPTLAGGNFVFTFGAVSNQSYTVESTDTLVPPHWTAFTNLTGNGGLTRVVAPADAAAQRFYRVRQP